MTPMIVGTVLAILALCFVLYPLFREPLGMRTEARVMGRDVGVTTAVDALREIEFDHVTGKLSDTDYAELKSSYTHSAVAAMRNGEPVDASQVVCTSCGPRPEHDAAYCSECGRALAA
ncbi:MAG TPA: hypothetical protein VII66_03940 [Gemmatimonadaceae bacterium]